MKSHSLIANYLLQGGTLQELGEKYAIKIKSHRKYPNLIHFEYSQRESPMHESLVQEARGLILDSTDHWKVINKTLTKFFNYGEPHAASVEWSSARVQEKADGSLINLWHYQDRWNISTTGSTDANGSVYNLELFDHWEIDTPNGTKIVSRPNSFAEYFWQVVHHKVFLLEDLINLNLIPHELCLAFELTGPLNPIVVKHPQPNLTLLMARNRETDQQYCGKEANQDFLNNWLTPIQEYSLSSIEDIINTFETMSPFEQEGYVVVDKYFNRIKIKNPKYVALHHCITEMNTKDFIRVIRNGEIEEVAAYSEIHKKILFDLKNQYENFIKVVSEDYEKIKNVTNQKYFAELALKTLCHDALFQVRAQKQYKTIKEYINELDVNKIIAYLKKLQKN